MKKIKIAIAFDFVGGLHFGGLLPGTHYVKMPPVPLKSYVTNVVWPWFGSEDWSRRDHRMLLDPETLKFSPLHLVPCPSFTEAIEKALHERLNSLVALCQDRLKLVHTFADGWTPTPDSPQFFYAPEMQRGKREWEFVNIPKQAYPSQGRMPLTPQGEALQALAPDLLCKLQRETHTQFEKKVTDLRQKDAFPFSYEIRCYSQAACRDGAYGESDRVLRRLLEKLEQEAWVIKAEIRNTPEPYDYPAWAGNAPKYAYDKIRSWGFEVEMDLREYRGRKTVVLELKGTPSRDRVYITMID